MALSKTVKFILAIVLMLIAYAPSAFKFDWSLFLHMLWFIVFFIAAIAILLLIGEKEKEPEDPYPYHTMD